MSYARPLETGTYIYTDGDNINFNLIQVPEDDIDIFLYKIYKTRRKEFKKRIRNGQLLIRNYKNNITLSESGVNFNE